MELIDEKNSRANQARPTAVVDEAVERYTLAAKEGTTFPPAVVYFPLGGTKTISELVHQKSKCVIIDGNNRQAAFKKANRPTIPVIILAADTASEMIQLLTVEANAWHGQPVTQDWRVRQAIHLNSIGWNMDEACSAAMVSKQLVQKRQSAIIADVRAKAMGIKKFSDLPMSTKVALSGIKDDVPFSALSRTVIATRMIHQDLVPILKEFRTFTSENERLKFIWKVQEDRKVEIKANEALGKSSRKIGSPKINLVSSIGKILAVDPVALAQGTLTQTEKTELLQRLSTLADHILEIQVQVESRSFV